jgi:hypothetical protein
MAQGHAGFAIVGCFTQDLVNNLIEAAVTERLPPVTFSLPSLITVDGRQVTLAGDFAVLPPTVTLADRPDGLVAVRARFVADLRLAGLTPFPVDVAVELGCSLLVGVSVAVVNNRFQVGLDLSQASFTQVDVTVTDGPALVRAYRAALTSGPVIAKQIVPKMA